MYTKSEKRLLVGSRSFFFCILQARRTNKLQRGSHMHCATSSDTNLGCNVWRHGISLRVVILVPKFRDFISAAYPNIVSEALGKVDELLQTSRAARSPDQSAMQAHRHQLGCAPPAFIDQISQIVFEIGGKFSTVTKPIDGETHVVLA